MADWYWALHVLSNICPRLLLQFE